MTLAAAVLLGACVAAEVAALGLAAAVFTRRGESSKTWGLVQKVARLFKSPLVRLLVFAVLADVLGAVCCHVANAGPRPRAGWHRVAYHVADVLVMAWPAAVAWAARAMFGAQKTDGLDRSKPFASRRTEEPSCPRSPSSGIESNGHHRSPLARKREGRGGRTTVHRVLALVNGSGATLPAAVSLSFALGTLVLVLAHPVPRVWTQRTLHAHEVLCVAVTWWTIWQSRPREGVPLLPWRVEHRALVVLASFETVVATVGPFAGDAFQRWPVVGCGLYLLAFSAVAGVLGWDLRRRA